MKKPRILVLIPTLNDDPLDTLKSLMEQTIKPSRILIAVGSKVLYQKLIMRQNMNSVELHYIKPDTQEPLGVRVAKALNFLLSKISLKDYDYLLRVDADTVLPPRFIEENLKANADCVGKAGYAMLLKMECFLKFFGGRFAEVSAEDSYIGLKLLSMGCNVKPWVLPPKLKRRSGAHHSWRYYFIRGVEMYKLGYEPIHVIDALRRDVRNVFALMGYMIAILKREKRYDIASWVFKAQLKRLIYRRKRWNIT